MKKILICFVTAILILPGIISISADTSSYKFKHTMHHVLDDYTHARISYSLKKYDVADILLKQNISKKPKVLYQDILWTG